MFQSENKSRNHDQPHINTPKNKPKNQGAYIGSLSDAIEQTKVFKSLPVFSPGFQYVILGRCDLTVFNFQFNFQCEHNSGLETGFKVDSHLKTSTIEEPLSIP